MIPAFPDIFDELINWILIMSHKRIIITNSVFWVLMMCQAFCKILTVSPSHLTHTRMLCDVLSASKNGLFSSFVPNPVPGAGGVGEQGGPCVCSHGALF